MKQHTLSRLLEDQAAKRAVALATDMDSGDQTLVYLNDADGPDGSNAQVLAAARQAIQDDRSKVYDLSGRRIFIETFNPPLRMLIVGAVHIAQPLSRMAAVAGYDVTVIDPRGSFATEERFPGIALNPDRRTAVVTLTHDPKLDDPGLEIALKSDAFYIGSLGSRKTHAGRVERFTSAGFTDTEIGRIHAPVGLNIGSISPAEIAVSILAQITEVLHRNIEAREAA